MKGLLKSQSKVTLDEHEIQLSEGNKRKIEMLSKLKAKNEEVNVRRELVKVIKQQEDEERIAKQEQQMNQTKSKFLFHLDIKKAE